MIEFDSKEIGMMAATLGSINPKHYSQIDPGALAVWYKLLFCYNHNNNGVFYTDKASKIEFK